MQKNVKKTSILLTFLHFYSFFLEIWLIYSNRDGLNDIPSINALYDAITVVMVSCRYDSL